MPPDGICEDPHEYPRRREASRKQLDEFLRNGTGTNHCLVDDADLEPAVADGVCSWPSLSGCTNETEETVAVFTNVVLVDNKDADERRAVLDGEFRFLFEKGLPTQYFQY